jgi:hypothetical protein
MRSIAARRAEIGARHHVPRGARGVGHAHHPPKQRIHGNGRQVARWPLFHLDPCCARRHRWARHHTLGTRTVDPPFAENLMLSIVWGSAVISYHPLVDSLSTAHAHLCVATGDYCENIGGFRPQVGSLTTTIATSDGQLVHGGAERSSLPAADIRFADGRISKK